MNLSFSKSYLSSYHSDDNVLYKELRLYYVYKKNNLLGQYFRQNNKQFCKFQNEQIKIESTEKWFERTEYKIVDVTSDEAIGEFILPYPYNHTFYHYPEVPFTNPYLKVILYNTEYEFRRQKGDTEYSLLDSTTWGYYRFGLYDKQNLCVVEYNFKIEHSLLDGSIIFNNNLFGSIKTNESNVPLLFTGFFLLEKFIDDQDRKG